MTNVEGSVTGGVDTHGQTHHAAVIDQVGRQFADAQFPTTSAGYRALLTWLRSHGQVDGVGVEGTGAYGAALCRYLREQGVVIVEVDRPDRKTRRTKGKSDPIDAYAAARAALSGQASGTPKTRDGKGRSDPRVTAGPVQRGQGPHPGDQPTEKPARHRTRRPAGQLRPLDPAALVEACARLRPGADLTDPAVAVTTALRRLATRIQALNTEIAEADRELAPLVAAAAPRLVALMGVGPEVAGQLLVTAGDNPDRLRSEAAFAHLCGVAPLPASSGRTDRHRLNRGGDRAANCALYRIVLCRLRHDPATQAYAERRTKQGLSKPEIIRCLKRYVAREVYHTLVPRPTIDLSPAA